MALEYTMIGNNPENIRTKVKKGDKKKNTRDLIASKHPADDFYKDKAKYDAFKDMSNEKYDPTEGKKKGRRLLDKLLKDFEV